MRINSAWFPVVVFAALFTVWFAPSPTATPSASFAPASAFAGVGVADENSETLFTASADGKTIYMWQYFSSKPPKFIGQAEAVLSE